ncbi:two-component system response regulator NarL [Sedimenticola thiotaurini]|uniref:Transcriptional regulator NarL n=1 Tax=Sedimenticola thiotaurini TaxID=1543721 RepID=A0A0F7JXC8_9GAMM|nr:two-component system response regulator NarL [Sedimenticola thiotaurini]AKH19999.1 transcriptional regulator NarL [Sedimenticola thiotaurini]
MAISILIIDDHPLFRKGLADLIGMDPGLQLVAEAASGEEGLSAALALKPELILLDLNMKGMDGLETLKALKQTDLESFVVMLTVSDNESDVTAALRLGADGYLLKDMEPESVLEHIQIAASGRLAITDTLTELLARALREDGRPRSIGEAGLTRREEEILALIASGMSNKQIARELDIAEGTIKVHVKHLLKKLNLRTRLEAAVWCVKNSSSG